jgi:acyl-CoA hydrolase
MTQIMAPIHANAAGNVHGGAIMRLVDEAAGIAAMRHCGRRVVTAQADQISFLHPVFVGDLVTVRGSVNASWHTSMEVGVRVEAERIRTGEILHTSSAYLTMVALDDDGKPTPVPGVEPTTPDEERRIREATVRRDSRLETKERILSERTGAGQ